MKSTTARRGVALAAALTLSLGTAACSKAEEPAPAGTAAAATTSAATQEAAPSSAEIFEKVKANATAAKTATVTGHVADPEGDVDLVLKGAADGSTADVRLTIAGQGEAHLLVVGDTLYMKGDQAFWEAQDAAEMVDLAGDKYVKIPAGEMSGMFESFTIASLTKELFDGSSGDDVSAEVGEESVDGVDCWVLTDDTDEAKMYVSKDDFMLVRLVGPANEGQFDFTGWNEEVEVTAPAAKDVVDLG